MLFLFHAGNLGNLVLVKLLKKAVNGAYQVWILLKNDAKIKNCFQLSLKIGTGTFEKNCLIWIFDKKFAYGTDIVSVVWQTNRRKISNVLRYHTLN